MESVLGVALSGNTTEVIRDDILLCRLMNKLHPGMIQYIHEEVRTDTIAASNTSWLQTLIACISVNNAFSRMYNDKSIQDTAAIAYLSLYIC